MTDSLQSAKSDKPDAKMVLAEMLDWLAQHGLSGPTDTGDLMQRGYKALAASQARVEELENLLVNWLVAIGRSGEHWPSIEKETIDALQVSGHVRSDIDTGGEDG